MELDVLKALLQEYDAEYEIKKAAADLGERYYKNDTDVMRLEPKEDDEGDPLHNADNRIPGGFHRLLVKQKAAYMLTYPPMFDLGSDQANKKLTEVLGDKFTKRCKKLCVDSSNGGEAWVHYWEKDNEFKYCVIKTQQILPIWSDDVEEELEGVVRIYRQLDTEEGRWYTIYEVWNDTECQAYRRPSNGTINDIENYDMFDLGGEPTDIFKHSFGRVPFIQFRNNDECMSDLTNTLKGLIDSYDKTYCGFVNDLEDIQEIIFVLSGYGGENKAEFIHDLKKYKTVKLDPEEGSDLKTLNIEIPVEAREKLLEITRKAIFEQGQGMDPLQESFGTKSGEALKFMYCLLELKAGDTETEFRSGFAELIRAICEHESIKCDTINQTWTRNAIRNEKEQADICNNSVGVISNRTIITNHPFVDNVEEEVKQLEEEQNETQEEDYPDDFKSGRGGEKVDGEE